ncbi:2-amino-3,7-dideoxy-D-threo-hept-6-ulosonate synthase [soil metagenome]
MTSTAPSREQASSFLAADGRTVIVALDHALASGQIAPLDRPTELLASVLAGAPDALIATPGMARLLGDDGLPWLLTADYYATSAIPGRAGEDVVHVPLWSPEHARRSGAVGLKCLLVYGHDDPRVLGDNVRFVARLIEDAHAIGLSVMVEAVLWGRSLAPAWEHDGALVAHAARTAYELGADVIKVALPDDTAALATLARAIPIPIVMMGGPATDPAALFPRLRSAIDAGVRGVALGRNVWGSPQPEAVVRALRAMIHDDAPADVALAMLREAVHGG